MINLGKIATFLFICSTSSNCAAKDEPKNLCDQWIINAAKTVESAPSSDRFKRSLEQLQSACETTIPGELRQAATKSLAALSVKERQNILLQATTSYFSKSCLDIAADQPAKKLMHICLGEDFPNGPYTPLLPNIDAAAYLYGKAIEQELKKSGLDQFHAKKFLLNYFLGAALEREKNSQSR